MPDCTSTVGCKSEQAAARLLGYSQRSWDNISGKEKQPSSGYKYWSKLTVQEKKAAMILGYTAKTWDNSSGKEKQPASANKYWAKLSACGEHLLAARFFVCVYAISLFFAGIHWVLA